MGEWASGVLVLVLAEQWGVQEGAARRGGAGSWREQGEEGDYGEGRLDEFL